MPTRCGFTDPELHFHYAEDEIPANAPFQMHIHENFEIFCFQSGDANYLVESTSYPLQPGSVMLMRPGEAHKLEILGNCTYERYSIEFSEKLLDPVDPAHKLLEPFLQRPLGQNNLYPAQMFPGVSPQHYFKNMCRTLPDEKDRRTQILIYLYPLLGAIRTIYLEGHTFTGTPFELNIEKMILYINEHLAEELSVSMLADKFYMSVSHCERYFKKATGSSLWEYILIKRLLRARRMIQSGMPSTEAYLTCGFHDYSSFYRAYVKRFGISPKADSIASRQA